MLFLSFVFLLAFLFSFFFLFYCNLLVCFCFLFIILGAKVYNLLPILPFSKNFYSHVLFHISELLNVPSCRRNELQGCMAESGEGGELELPKTSHRSLSTRQSYNLRHEKLSQVPLDEL